jgi:hypothetical protein
VKQRELIRPLKITGYSSHAYDNKKIIKTEGDVDHYFMEPCPEDVFIK